MSSVVSLFLAHYGLAVSFLTGLVSKSSLASLYTKVKSFFTTAEADVKKVL